MLVLIGCLGFPKILLKYFLILAAVDQCSTIIKKTIPYNYFYCSVKLA